MSTSTTAPIIDLYASSYARETYASQQMSEIHKMSPEDHQQTLDEMPFGDISKRLP